MLGNLQELECRICQITYNFLKSVNLTKQSGTVYFGNYQIYINFQASIFPYKSFIQVYHVLNPTKLEKKSHISNKNMPLLKSFTLRKTYPYSELFWSAFPAFGLTTERDPVYLRIQFKCGKMRTRIRPNTVIFFMKIRKQNMIQIFFHFPEVFHFHVF